MSSAQLSPTATWPGSSINDSAAVERDSVNSIGVPVDNLSIDEAVEKIIQLAGHYDSDKGAGLAVTVNLDFLINALGYGYRKPRHPELLEILRSADLSTATGFPILLLSRMLGRRLKQRVVVSDLVPLLARRASEEHLSVYLLGGSEGSAWAASEVLKMNNPELYVAGCNAPVVHISGQELAGSAEDDERIIADINAAAPKILLLGLGNPKQELWFHRNHSRLRVPITICVGDTFEILCGRVKRAPNAWQRANLEWVYRIMQNPRRLWRRYAVNLFKFTVLALPLIILRCREIITRPLRASVRNRPASWNTMWGGRDDVTRMARLPRFLSRQTLVAVERSVNDPGEGGSLTLLDFSNVRHIELAANQVFFNLAQQFSCGLKKGAMIGISGKLRRRLAVCRLLDLVEDADLEMDAWAFAGAASGENTRCRSYIINDATIIYLFGAIDGPSLRNLGFAESVSDAARDRNTVIDLRYITRVDSSTVGEFMRVDTMSVPPCSVLISGASHDVRQCFKLAGAFGRKRFISDAELSRKLGFET